MPEIKEKQKPGIGRVSVQIIYHSNNLPSTNLREEPVISNIEED
ncbi:MAG: hypothetical protein ABRQ38_17880 [Candidatus Eremiobacterota bacterium]